MSRPKRSTPGGVVQHVLNRGNDRKRLFTTDADYAAFISIVLESLLLHPLRILEYCVMPNHWHFVVWPAGDDDLSAFMHRLTTTHATRWNAWRGRTGWGHVYQGPFKSFPVQADGHLLTVCRYVVRRPAADPRSAAPGAADSHEPMAHRQAAELARSGEPSADPRRTRITKRFPQEGCALWEPRVDPRHGKATRNRTHAPRPRPSPRQPQQAFYLNSVNLHNN